MLDTRWPCITWFSIGQILLVIGSRRIMIFIEEYFWLLHYSPRWAALGRFTSGDYFLTFWEWKCAVSFLGPWARWIAWRWWEIKSFTEAAWIDIEFELRAPGPCLYYACSPAKMYFAQYRQYHALQMMCHLHYVDGRLSAIADGLRFIKSPFASFWSAPQPLQGFSASYTRRFIFGHWPRYLPSRAAAIINTRFSI